VPVHSYPISDLDLQKLLPGAKYMDPPDGGSVTLIEQLQRMAKDAERYRWLRERMMAADFNYNESGAQALVFEMPAGLSYGCDCDAVIDAGMMVAPK
jgi:hypothetical protein